MKKLLLLILVSFTAQAQLWETSVCNGDLFYDGDRYEIIDEGSWVSHPQAWRGFLCLEEPIGVQTSYGWNLYLNNYTNASFIEERPSPIPGVRSFRINGQNMRLYISRSPSNIQQNTTDASNQGYFRARNSATGAERVFRGIQDAYAWILEND